MLTPLHSRLQLHVGSKTRFLSIPLGVDQTAQKQEYALCGVGSRPETPKVNQPHLETSQPPSTKLSALIVTGACALQ